ncbi:interleukin 17-like protein [Saccostrea echinata]|uniref:interleukin 17-like protein n=1 Tax=Saccostrea echinata TaxID=191078 RepID=UPI002A822B91|nr:interleukin 17-like protein [Saccostrea echinata]
MYRINSCKDMSNWRIKQKLGYNPRETDMSFNIIPPIHQRRTKFDKFEKEVKDKSSRLFGNSTCPSVLDTFERHAMFRSSCPWYIELSVDKTRIPVTMAKAKCSCTECIMNVSSGRQSRPNPGFSCETVKTYRKVLREILNECDQNGFKMYRVDIEEVPVACTCVATRETG